MGHIKNETYLEAFSAAIAQRNQIVAEFESLKNRRALVEAAARALEPVVYPDEYRANHPDEASPSLVQFNTPVITAESRNTAAAVESGARVPAREEDPKPVPVQAVTQVYVRGDGEPDEEIQRRISIAIGRCAAD